MSGSNGRRIDAAPAVTALPDGAELVALVPDTAMPGRKVVRRIGKAAVAGTKGGKGDRGDPGPSGAADGIPPSALAAGAALSATDQTFVIQGEEAKLATLSAMAAAAGLSLNNLAQAGPFADADTVLIGQGGEAKRTTLADLVAHVASKIGASGGGGTSQTASTSSPPGQVPALTATALSHRRVRLAWSAPLGEASALPEGATSYEVARSPAGQNAYVTQASGITSTGPLVFEQSDLSTGASYDYRVTPSNSYGAGTPRVVTVTTLTVPGQVQNLRTGPFETTDTAIPFQWDAVADATYKIEHSTDGGATWTVGATNWTQTTTTYSNLTAGTTRRFRVSASYDGATFGPVSAVLAASTTVAAQSGSGALALDGAGWSGKVPRPTPPASCARPTPDPPCGCVRWSRANRAVRPTGPSSMSASPRAATWTPPPPFPPWARPRRRAW